MAKWWAKIGAHAHKFQHTFLAIFGPIGLNFFDFLSHFWWENGRGQHAGPLWPGASKPIQKCNLLWANCDFENVFIGAWNPSPLNLCDSCIDFSLIKLMILIFMDGYRNYKIRFFFNFKTMNNNTFSWQFFHYYQWIGLTFCW